MCGETNLVRQRNNEYNDIIPFLDDKYFRIGMYAFNMYLSHNVQGYVR